MTVGELGVGAGVLSRAFQSRDRVEPMQRDRKTDKLIDLARGPGRLAETLQVDHHLDGVNQCSDGPLLLGTPVQKTARMDITVRIGITREVAGCRAFLRVTRSFPAQRLLRQWRPARRERGT